MQRNPPYYMKKIGKSTSARQGQGRWASSHVLVRSSRVPASFDWALHNPTTDFFTLPPFVAQFLFLTSTQTSSLQPSILISYPRLPALTTKFSNCRSSTPSGPPSGHCSSANHTPSDLASLSQPQSEWTKDTVVPTGPQREDVIIVSSASMHCLNCPICLLSAYYTPITQPGVLKLQNLKNFIKAFILSLS